MQNQRVNILHISDLHYRADQAHDHDVVLQAFLEDLLNLSSSDLKPHLIVFSGDLVQRGECYQSYCEVLDKVIHPIIGITKLSESRVFLAPGNHDVQRSAVTANEIMQNGLEQTLLDRSSLNTYYLSKSGHEYARAKFHNFIQLKECLNNSSIVATDPYFDTYYVRELNVALIILNTAWMSRAGLAGRDDRGHLLVPESCIKRALEGLPATKARILVGHHPIDWLAEYAYSDFRRILEKEGLVYLHGHMHEPVSQSVRSTIGRSLVHQTDISQVAPVPWPGCSCWEHKATRKRPLEGRGWVVAALPRHGEPIPRLFRGSLWDRGRTSPVGLLGTLESSLMPGAAAAVAAGHRSGVGCRRTAPAAPPPRPAGTRRSGRGARSGRRSSPTSRGGS